MLSGNHFNDDNLSDVFVWKKKYKAMGFSKAEAKKHAEETKERNRKEIERAKKRRIERENELMERLKERERLERERDSASHAGWEAREEEFMLRQHREATAIRINEGRETPADVFARNVFLTKQLKYGPELGPDGKEVNVMSKEVGFESQDPFILLSRLKRPDLEQLKVDVLKYRQSENPRSEFYDYWSSLLVVCEDLLNPPQVLNAILPKAICDSIHESSVNKTAKQLKIDRIDAEQKVNGTSTDKQLSPDEVEFYKELQKRYFVEESHANIRAVHESMAKICKENNRTAHFIHKLNETSAEQDLPRIVQQGDDGENDHVEDSFAEVVNLGPQDPKLIIPKYWNRVKQGYDWNKYNKAHFDRDNPPPKTVFGYKFNILYPNLGKTPSYRLERDRINPDKYCILRFSTGPPFADIAFRIENKDWEKGLHSSFKSTFENGILQLHFNFVRRRYRR